MKSVASGNCGEVGVTGDCGASCEGVGSAAGGGGRCGQASDSTPSCQIWTNRSLKRENKALW